MRCVIEILDISDVESFIHQLQMVADPDVAVIGDRSIWKHDLFCDGYAGFTSCNLLACDEVIKLRSVRNGGSGQGKVDILAFKILENAVPLAVNDG